MAFAARRPALHIDLDFVDEEVSKAKFDSSLRKKIERKVASDALFLPKSTNMGLPAHVSTGDKYNFEEDLERSQDQKIPTKATCTFRRSMPCFYVSHVPSALPWYKEVLGFNLVGKAEAGRAELHRAEPGAAKGVGGVSLYLRKPPTEDLKITGSALWVEVDDVDGLYKEFQHKLDKYRQDLSDYFPAHHFGSSEIQAKPRNSGWGQREMTVVDDVGNRIVFFQELNTK